MLFKDIYLELCLPLCLVDQKHLCNFGRAKLVEGIMGNIHAKSFKIWTSGNCFEFGSVVKMLFKDISYLELWLPFSGFLIGFNNQGRFL